MTIQEKNSSHRIPARKRSAPQYRQLQALQIENRRLRRLVITDELTGIFNRRYFTGRLQEALQAHQRGNGVALCLFDLDNFKTVNDSLGHAAGDRLLQAVARTVETQLRRTDDCVCRIGGDEFATIFSANSPDKALEQAKQLLDSIRNVQVQGIKRISATFGLIWLPPGASQDWQQAYASADSVLCRAKQKGKGGIMIHDAPLLPA
ncbi:GGDEF domain-containing protein [Bordetella avium]|uniref:GGDEF domain-containing protein n=1 Tax=Bordetella avium TaxID=521 RepID=UPI000E0A90D7|nr:GGDEF domain-containing protein [Bordetella avium]RIQ13023.1 diguanylate cyclase [Bordetella avium]RIQ37585.1 diguanylate cyclase [Bordetella avium]RIQ42286.1 diguanylate cyclase [Bordetella avium]RIQ42735.1 diguanylate cyclase [Bordetella avium]RIQ49198.1 diguanylate cyclase [Bordetella avium]